MTGANGIADRLAENKDTARTAEISVEILKIDMAPPSAVKNSFLPKRYTDNGHVLLLCNSHAEVMVLC